MTTAELDIPLGQGAANERLAREKEIAVAVDLGPSAADQPVLIVDDDASVRTMLATMFRSDGWQVAEAQDGDEGLRVTLKIRPWAAVVDVHMPGLSGLHLTRVLRRAGLGSEQLRIIIFTAGMTTDQDAIEAGADRLFLKGDWLQLRQALRADALAPYQPAGGPVFAF